ncbi:3-carboxy-cis,cis-muconate cycloisomerase [Rhodococcus sp. BP-316]|uniref:lyase family protein n=1 Tax=Rhodococcus sp. BP-316 TaxID=2739445 RepID=UPI001C9B55A8|nr:lyase family protein [Rhodococcus sp. BP-316]MBY6683083.1 3-carboxy-cis,cis-muconate cycloisomerase [Rhodococcus sp. BP-316]
MTRGHLFDPTFGARDVSATVSDQAWVTAVLDVEAALGRAAARHELIAPEHAGTIAAAAAELGAPGGVDIETLGIDAAVGGNPVIPLVSALRAAVAMSGVPASAVHIGATSQDILDTALMLIVKNSIATVRRSIAACIDAGADLALVHRGTPMAARTLGQQALPTTFGAVAAGWTSGLLRADDALAGVAAAASVQFGCAAGTSAAVHPYGLRLADSLADELGLTHQGIPWHTDRTRIAEIAGALGTAAGAIAKPALDITSLASTELGEVSEGSPGGSSAMPHKRNPIAAVTARAAVRRVPGLVATVLAGMDHEHQRATGAWHAEWETMTDLLRLTAGGADRLAVSMGGLLVHADAMARNLDITHGLLLAERVTTALDAHTDRAREIVTAACAAGVTLDTDPAITEYLEPAAVRHLLDPADYLGHAGGIVDLVLSVVHLRTGGHHDR